MWLRILSILLALSLTLVVFAFAETSRSDALSRDTSPWADPEKSKSEKMLAELKADLGREFSYTTSGPWIIATDLDKEQTDAIVAHTIGEYAAAIQRQLFTKARVTEPLKVLLFKDGESYTAWNMKLFNEKPTSPYGYFSRTKHALVMNIGTGGGTLVHEMTHAMAEADFPSIPAWLNEGLGSLFEAPSKVVGGRGRVVGIKNWRLRSLLDDLAKGSAVHYRDLIGIADADFYGEHRSANYASMRYLMQWLQEKGKLETFYARIRDGKGERPQDALRAVFDNAYTVDEIETQVYAWVKTL